MDLQNSVLLASIFVVLIVASIISLIRIIMFATSRQVVGLFFALSIAAFGVGIGLILTGIADGELQVITMGALALFGSLILLGNALKFERAVDS